MPEHEGCRNEAYASGSNLKVTPGRRAPSPSPSPSTSFLCPPQIVCRLCQVREETVVWQRGIIPLMFAVLLTFFPIIAPEGLWRGVSSSGDFYGFSAACAALSLTDSLS